MARSKIIQIIRTTRANLETQKAANNLLDGELYLITDEARLAIGTGVNSYQDYKKASEKNIDFIGFEVGDGTNVITTGLKEKRVMPACTILGWYLIANETGSITIDIHKSTFANYPTTASICASALPALSSASKNSDTTLTGWTTAISDTDVLEFYVDTVATVKKVHLFVKVQYAI